MIIKEIKLGKGLLFKKEELIIISDSGKSGLKIKLDNLTFESLKKTLEGKELNNIQDLQKISEQIIKIDPNLEKQILLGIINSSDTGWKLINTNIKNIPRPMSLIYKKDKGIKEFYLTSLNASNFDGVIAASRDVATLLEKKLSNLNKTLNDDELLGLIKEFVDKIFEDIEFELRICVNFSNYSNNKYIYNDKELDEKDQIDYVKNLIKIHDLFYIENPFYEGNLDSYKKLSENFRDKSLICLNSKINEYTEGVDKNCFNAVVLNYNNFTQFRY